MALFSRGSQLKFQWLPILKQHYKAKPTLRFHMGQPATALRENMAGDKFAAFFPRVVDELLQEQDKESVGVEMYRDRLSKILNFNVPDGKRNRGTATVNAYVNLQRNRHTPTNDKDIPDSCFLLGWCMELLQAYLIMLDDLMDASETRRGRACWHTVNGVGVFAINDAILVYSAIFTLLKRYFQHDNFYPDLMELFTEANRLTTIGQMLDTNVAKEKNFKSYTMELYSDIAKFKTSHYSFYLPAKLALVACGTECKGLILDGDVRHIAFKMGHYFQVQDDYIDCFGDHSVTGKIGTDIENAKCTWLFVTALELCNPEKREILFANYGLPDSTKVAKVKRLYEDLSIPSFYKTYDEMTLKSIQQNIAEMDPRVGHVFSFYLKKLEKRAK